MDTKALNKRKDEILNQQTLMLQKATEAKVKLTETEEAQFNNFNAELDEINTNIKRFDAIAKGRAEVGAPVTTPVIADSNTNSKFWAMGGYRKATALPQVNDDYAKKFWASLQTKSTFDRFLFENASLGEGGTSTAGGALVPIATDPSIPAMAIEETVCRQLSRVIETESDLKLRYQSVKTTAALKTESNSSGTNNFATNSPGFAVTTLSAYTLGDEVIASWELLRDVKAASQFISEDLQRAIRVKEENLFINGSGSGQPQGYLGNGTTAVGSTITAGAGTLNTANIIDTMGSLNRAYYQNASWLVNRQEFNRLLKAQVASSQYQTFVTFDPNGNARLFGYPVAFSAEMGVFVASPAANGNWMFGDFNRFATIGDRGGSNIYIKVVDQLLAAQGQTAIFGYRYTDQRILLAEAVVQFNANA